MTLAQHRPFIDADGAVRLLTAALAGSARLPEAACIGRPDLFDPAPDPDDPAEHPDDLGYRLSAAKRICEHCPALDACRDWAQAMPAHAVAGVIAAGTTRRRVPAPAAEEPPAPHDPLDVDSETWTTLREAMSLVQRTRPTILRWVKLGVVRERYAGGVRAFCVEDLVDAEAEMHRRQQATRTVAAS